MTTRNPVVFIPGGTPVLQELPVGDSLAGATVGATGPTGSQGSQGTQGTQGATGAAGSNGTMVQLSQVVTSSSQATIAFSSISGSYTNLLIVLMGRDTTAGTSDSNIFLKMNTDTTAGNYDGTVAIIGTGAAVSSTAPSSATTGGVIATLPNDGATAGACGMAKIEIPSYAGTTYFKSAISEGYDRVGTSPSKNLYYRAFQWKSTAAITALTLTAGTAFKDGSVATLYGF